MNTANDLNDGFSDNPNPDFFDENLGSPNKPNCDSVCGGTHVVVNMMGRERACDYCPCAP
jgi:hypothetical protein